MTHLKFCLASQCHKTIFPIMFKNEKW